MVDGAATVIVWQHDEKSVPAVALRTPHRATASPRWVFASALLLSCFLHAFILSISSPRKDSQQRRQTPMQVTLKPQQLAPPASTPQSQRSMTATQQTKPTVSKQAERSEKPERAIDVVATEMPKPVNKVRPDFEKSAGDPSPTALTFLNTAIPQTPPIANDALTPWRLDDQNDSSQQAQVFLPYLPVEALSGIVASGRVEVTRHRNVQGYDRVEITTSRGEKICGKRRINPFMPNPFVDALNIYVFGKC